MTIRVEDEAVMRALSAARRDLNARVRSGLKLAATKAALPKAKIEATSKVAPYLTAGASGTKAYITTRGPKVYDRIAGLQEFGGTVREHIYPQAKKAVTPGSGIVSQVTTPRRYRPQNRILRGVQRALPSMATTAKQEILEAFGPLAK